MLGQIDLYGWTGKIGDELIKVGVLIYKKIQTVQLKLNI